jgi:FHA domain-containing protein
VVNSLQRFERFFERLMEGSVGRIFRSPIQPAEIGRRLERAMEGNQLATVDGIVVPNDYSVYLNPQDMVLYTDFVTSLCRQMEDWLIDLADERNYGFIDQVRVQMFGDDRIEPRTISVDAHIAELPGYDPVQQEAVQRTEVYRVVERTGNVPPQLLRVTSAVRPEEMFSIRRQLTTIGRSLDNDVVIPEPEVSRYHARIEYVNGHLEIVDLESTNGTIVNGTQVRRRAIEQGDSVVVGNAKLELLPYRGAMPQGTQGRPR